jgi:hypothetical protein
MRAEPVAIDDDAKRRNGELMPYGAAQFGNEASSAGPSQAARQLLGANNRPRKAAGTAGLPGQP